MRVTIGAAALVLLGVGCGSPSDEDLESATGAATEGPRLAPANWNVDADPESPTPGSEPLNVIVTTAVPMDEIVDALGTVKGLDALYGWQPVRIGVGLDFLTTGGKACMSAEKANIDGAKGGPGTAPQELSLRVGGCFGVLYEGENHARLWESAARRTATTATWYLAVSEEHLCTIPMKGAQKKWHCILPNGYVGKKVTAETGGYNEGRDHFVADLERAGAASGWDVRCKPVARPAGRGLRVPGVAPVTWDDHATHCAVSRIADR